MDSPSLLGAHARHARAEEHIVHLGKEIAEYRSQFDNEFVPGKVHVRPRGGRGRVISAAEHRNLEKLRTTPPPPIISILIGETVYNLRAALDYLVYELAWLDSTQIQEDTQFPLEESPETFWELRVLGKRRPKAQWLKGVSPTHVLTIERFQPYQGCHWARLLRELSNPDKHKELTEVRKSIGSIQHETGTPTETEAGTTKHIESKWAALLTIHGERIESALLKLHREVGNVLALFDPEF